MDNKLWDRLKPGLTLLLLLTGLVLVATKIIGMTWRDAVTLAIFLPILVGWTYSDRFFPTENPTDIAPALNLDTDMQEAEQALAAILYGVIVDDAGTMYMQRPKSVHNIHVSYGYWPLPLAENPGQSVPIPCYRVQIKKALTDAAQKQSPTRIGGNLQLLLREAKSTIQIINCFDDDLVWDIYMTTH